MSTPPNDATAQDAATPSPTAQFVLMDDPDLVQFELPPPKTSSGYGLERLVQRNPAVALLAAAGLGFLLGRLLR